MKTTDRFLASCQPCEELDFYKQHEDEYLLLYILSRDWKTKLKLFKTLKMFGQGIASPAQPMIVTTPIKPPKGPTNKPKKLAAAIENLLEGKELSLKYIFRLTKDYGFPLYKTHLELHQLATEHYIKPFISELITKMQEHADNALMLPEPEEFQTNPNFSAQGNLQQLTNFLKPQEMSRYLILTRAVLPEEMTNPDTLFDISHKYATANAEALYAISSKEDQEYLMDQFNIYWGDVDGLKRSFNYLIAPEIGKGVRGEPLIDTYDRNTPELIQQYQESYDYYNNEVLLPPSAKGYTDEEIASMGEP